MQKAFASLPKRESSPYGSRRKAGTTAGYVSAFSRRHPPEFCKFVRPKKEGAGKTGCALHPRSRVQTDKQKRTRAYRFSGSIRPSLRNGLRLIPCSPRRDQSLFVTVARKKRELLANLTPAIGASGPHDFAVRVSRARQSQPPRPPHPTARFVTCATPLLPGGMAHEATDLGKKQSGIFLARILDPALVYSARRAT